MSKASKTDCFEACPFHAAVHPGLDAIGDREIKKRIHFGSGAIDSSALSSVDIDTSMRGEYPEVERWDYGICYGKSDRKIAFVEVHPAESGEVEKLLGKQRWLKDLLVGIHVRPSTWFWMATRKSKILPQSRYMRQLQSARIQLVKGELVLD